MYVAFYKVRVRQKFSAHKANNESREALSFEGHGEVLH